MAARRSSGGWVERSGVQDGRERRIVGSLRDSMVGGGCFGGKDSRHFKGGMQSGSNAIIMSENHVFAGLLTIVHTSVHTKNYRTLQYGDTSVAARLFLA